MESLKLEGQYQQIADMMAEEQEPLLERENVVGIGVGHQVKNDRETGDPALTVMVSQKLPKDMLKSHDLVPDKVGKFKTDVIETGEIMAGTLIAKRNRTKFKESENTEPWMQGMEEEVELAELPTEYEEEDLVSIQALRRKVRPVQGGFEIGPRRARLAGTMATAVFDAMPYGIPRKYYALSNNHVMALSNYGHIGDQICQPASGSPTDIIARLSRFVPLRFRYGTPFRYPLNLVDAAIAEGQFHDLDREIYWIGYVKGVRYMNKIGEIVQKTGRTTNYTTGKVLLLNATVNVNYGGGKVARFAQQIVTTNMSGPGDSGSLLLDMKENAVGLLFAGSGRVTIHNHIIFVQRLLGIRIV